MDQQRIFESSPGLGSLLKSIRERKMARTTAREEEKKYLEERKREVLSAIQPKSMALRSGDDVS